MPSHAPLHQPVGVSTAGKQHVVSPSRTYGRQWQALRRAYLAAHPVCECGCGYPATVVDHRVPHNGDRALMYAWDNLQAMTKPCHDRKTATHDGGFGNQVR